MDAVDAEEGVSRAPSENTCFGVQLTGVRYTLPDTGVHLEVDEKSSPPSTMVPAAAGGVRAAPGWMRSRRVEVWEPQSDRFGVRAGRGRVPHVADVLARVSFGRRRLFGTEQAPVGLGGNGPAVASDKDIIAGTRS